MKFHPAPVRQSGRDATIRIIANTKQTRISRWFNNKEEYVG